MICFQVEVNGQTVATAGVGGSGSLGAHLTWMKPNPADPNQKGKEQVSLGVSGFTQPPGESEWVTCKWLDRPMKPGDVIVLRIVDQDQADPPIAKDRIDKLLRPDPQTLLSHIEKAFASLREEIEKKSEGTYTI